MNPVAFNSTPVCITTNTIKPIHVFSSEERQNVDEIVVKSFGDEWDKFNDFDDKEIDRIGGEYFDIAERKLTKNSYVIDIGCGSGRWSKYLADKVGFIEAVDPSNAIYVADRLLGNKKNVRLSQASSDSLPFDDNTFDFGMSVGVLHHIPDTKKALADCVKKIKRGGFFYVYLYYDFADRGFLFRSAFRMADLLRGWVSRMPSVPKKIICDMIALSVYMPMVVAGKAVASLGFKRFADKLPLSTYRNKSFYIMRNDALDRFGTTLEQRFSKSEIEEMMKGAGLAGIEFSNGMPYHHAIGQKQ
jgi:ubiquinone/menaquinone biosynthesis C-methylase UbiE